MKDILQSILDATTSTVSRAITIEEFNKRLDVSYSTRKENLCDYSRLMEVLKEFPDRDKVRLEIRDVTDDGICLNNDNCIEEREYRAFLDSIMDDEDLSVSIHVEKNIVDNILSVYNLKAFNSYILGLSIIDVLRFVEEDLQNDNQIVFELFNSDLFVATSSMVFRPIGKSSSVAKVNRKEKMEECQKNCYVFWNGNNLPIPEDFHFVLEDDANPYAALFRKIETILSIIYIADNVHFQDQQVSCQLYGKRMNTIDICFDDVEYNAVLFDIYYWIYTEGNVVDKVTLARNLLSLHCKYVSLQNLDKQTFMSIKANFSIYQKENVDKYIELKNKLTEFLANMINESRDIVLSIVGDIGKNIVAFFSFMLTVFISSIMSEKGLEGIFTKEVTAFSYLICICSLVYVGITNYITGFKVKKLQESYKMLKENNDFFKDTKEYDEVFDDKKIEDTVKEIKKSRLLLIVLWVLMIIVVFIVVSVLSEYGIDKWITNALDCMRNEVKK